MIDTIGTVAIFCGSSPGNDPAFARAAENLAVAIASRDIRIVFGGAQVGLMGIVADTAIAHGAEVVGVIPSSMHIAEVSHLGLSRLEVVDTMHARKSRMATLADAFIALPGGYGTYEELLEVLTWNQLGIHQKPVAILNVSGFFTKLVEFLDGAVDRGFILKSHRDMLIVETDVDELIAKLGRWVPTFRSKWQGSASRPLPPSLR